MDPITHSLLGATIARAGLHRTTPLATTTLVIAANAPDIDVLAFLQGSYAALALRRGITHGPLGALVLPLLVAVLVLAYDRFWRRRAQRDVAPARAGAVLALALLGVLTHSPLDWMNTYGVRLLLPFDARWFYGDALFIIDPWIWLTLAATVVAHTRTRRGWIGWGAFASGATALVFFSPDVPAVARIVWTIGVAALVLQATRAHRRGARPGEHHARGALAIALLYTGVMLTSSTAGRSVAARDARARGFEAARLMIAPVPANPLAADIVVQTPHAYQRGALRWPGPRIRWSDSIPLGPRNDAVLATLRLEQVRDFLRWSRFPYVEIGEDEHGQFVRWGDARYAERGRGALSGVRVRIERDPRQAAGRDESRARTGLSQCGTSMATQVFMWAGESCEAGERLIEVADQNIGALEPDR